MIRALYISGNALFDQQTGVDTVSNNIANINTVGYKKSRTVFADMLYQTTKEGTTETNPVQEGLGSKLNATDTIMTQGDLIPTEKATDVAIQGNGFFTLLDPNAKGASPYYFSRAGDFSFDADNNLVNPDGYKVVGWLAQPDSAGNGFSLVTDEQTGIPAGNVEPINISDFQNVPATASTYIRFKANLNGGSKVEEYSPADANKNFDVLFNANGESLMVQDGDNFQVSYDNGKTWYTYEYDSDGNVSQGAEGFTTLGDLVSLMDKDIKKTNPDATVSLEDGKIKITNNSDNQMVVRVRPTTEDKNFPNPKENQKLTTVMTSMSQIILPKNSVFSQQMNVATHTVQSFFYDSSGEKHTINVVFKKIDTNKWEYSVILPDNDGTVENGTGTVVFDNDGGLDPNNTSPTVTVNLKNGTAPVELLINFWNTDSGNYEGNKYTGLTQFAMASDTSFQHQDGAPSGQLMKVNIDYQGDLIGSYSNGKSYTIAKLAISKFTNPQGLEKVGNSMFKLTPNVDPPNILASNGFIGAANHGGRGSVISSHLEMSNVNLTGEFTDLILYQRAFQANSRGVITADEILQTAIQLKR